MSGSLFRSEAIDSQRNSWMGSIALAQPPALRLLAMGAGVLGACLIALLVFGQYSSKARVSGQLVPDRGLIAVTALSAGVVVERRVQEGDRVRAGDVIAIVSGERQSRSGGTQSEIGEQMATRQRSLRRDLEQLKRLHEEQLAGAQSRLSSARAQREQLEATLATQRERAELANQTLARFEDLAKRGFVSTLQLQQSREAMLEQRAQTQAMQQQKLGLTREVATLEQELTELPLRAATQQGMLERELAMLGQELAENAARLDQVIKAPADGVIGALLVLPGQSLRAGQVIANLVPDGSRLEAHVYAPSRAIGFLAPGHAVQLRYVAFPHQKFGHQHGRILQISRNALSPAELDAMGLSVTQDVMYRVIIEIDSEHVSAYGRDEPLRPGMVLEADVLLERRRLFEWVLEPLYAAAGKV